MVHVTKYAKRTPNDSPDVAPSGGEPSADTALILRVTLGDMYLEDAFRVTLPPSYARLRLGEFLDRLFPTDDVRQARIREYFDMRENPDLPEIYDVLAEVFREWNIGRCTLRFFVNFGPELDLSEGLRKHLSVARPAVRGALAGAMLDLVIEQRYRPLDYAVGRGYARSKAELLEWLQDHTLLSLLEGDGLKLEVEPRSEAGRRLLPIASRLCEKDLLEPSQETQAFVVTREGKRLLANMVSEAESYIERYDVFKDVLYDLEARSAAFDTGRGEDLRVPVYEAEGLDPLRTVFLLRLYDADLEGHQHDLREGSFEQLLAPVVDHQHVDEATVEWIIERGFAYVEEQDEESRRLARWQEVSSRSKPG